MNKLQAIIFDFDGVILESLDIKGQAFRALYQEQGHTFQERVYQYHIEHGGVTRHKKIEVFEQWLNDGTIDEKKVLSAVDKFASIVEKAVVACDPVKGANEFLKEYSKKIPCHVASATPENELKRIVEKRDMSNFFASIHGAPITKSQNVGKIIHNYNYDQDKVVMVGDAIADYEAAQINSIPFIGRIVGDNDNIFPEDTATVRDLTDLSNRLREMFS